MPNDKRPDTPPGLERVHQSPRDTPGRFIPGAVVRGLAGGELWVVTPTGFQEIGTDVYVPAVHGGRFNTDNYEVVEVGVVPF